MLLVLFYWLNLAAYGEKPDYELVVKPSDVGIYVDETRFKVQPGLVSTYASLHKGTVRYTLTKAVAPEVYEGKVKIYNKTNISRINKTKCDYKKEAINCGKKNGHWTIVPSITKEDLHANFNLTLYDDDGEIISSSSVPIWGFIKLIPQYKITTIKENTMFGPSQKQIYEQYPPKRKKIPPMVTSRHISDAIMKLFLAIEVENI
tara:strand:+ start:501 stop:1112 length:612 start_codon:yes stop_codon:yes gene_type:complete